MAIDEAQKAQILSRLERLQRLLKELDGLAVTAPERQQVRDRIWRELQAAKDAVRLLSTQDPS